MRVSGKLAPSGDLGIKVKRAGTDAWVVPPQVAKKNWKYQIRNALRWAWIWGWIAEVLSINVAKLTGNLTFTQRLYGEKFYADGRREDLGILGRRVVTNAGVAFLVDDWDDDTTDITDMDYHEMGVCVGACDGESAADTALESAVETRSAGTATQAAANILQSVASITATAARVIVEHGLFSASSGGTLWDRTEFSAINLANGDGIQFTFQCTLTAGS
jgi:hypothetical protein